jgi:DMSO/TMAO reductase YedYZ molybdopterin-dependent catalytic subunit
MDRNTFESCSAPGCHQATWTDESGNEWSGVPLYYLAGRIDDGVRHEDRAYNDGFAKAGYVMQIFAADGYNVGIESGRTDFNRHIFIASMVNGEPLDEKNFPLRLVGEGLEKSEMVGQIAQIVIQPNEGVAMPSGEPPAEEVAEEGSAELVEMVLPEGAALMVYGQVMNKLTLGMENLQAMNVVTLEAEHPKKGVQSYQGVRLNDLLNLAGADAGAATLVIVSSDSYTAEASLGDIRNCADCLLAFAEDGTLSMVMPGLDSNFWVKEVNFLEVK